MKLPPFHTTNDGLAFALMNSGFVPAFIANLYTAKKLAALGYDPDKWEALKAVKDARLHEKPGMVRFYFTDTTELRSALAAWDEQGRDHEAGKTVTLKRPTREDMMKMAHQLTQTKGAFRKHVLGLPAMFEHRDGEPQLVEGAAGEFTIVCPGFILASEHLSREKAAKLGLV